MTCPRIAALIVAAGRGVRASDGGGIPKQYRLLAGKPMLERAIGAFASHDRIDAVQVVIHGDDRERYESIADRFSQVILPPALGGATRQETVAAGLAALRATSPDRVLIHDAARPLVCHAVIDRVLAALDERPAAIAALPVADTLKRAVEGPVISATVDRAALWRAQTPQGFFYPAIVEAHERAARSGLTHFTDDASLAEWIGLEVALVTGSERNLKVSFPEDFDLAERLIADPQPFPDVRTGTGYDVHRLVPGDHVWLCGVKIEHSQSLEGHSDADVGLHALTDAILGAIADGDIGQHFPPSDPKWRGAASQLFLRDAARRVADLGGTISNADVTLLCEAPKIAPHRTRMREAIGAILGIGAGRVGVKATTTEKLGFTGRGEGIAAIASATVILPPEKKCLT